MLSNELWHFWVEYRSSTSRVLVDFDESAGDLLAANHRHRLPQCHQNFNSRTILFLKFAHIDPHEFQKKHQTFSEKKFHVKFLFELNGSTKRVALDFHSISQPGDHFQLKPIEQRFQWPFVLDTIRFEFGWSTFDYQSWKNSIRWIHNVYWTKLLPEVFRNEWFL